MQSAYIVIFTFFHQKINTKDIYKAVKGLIKFEKQALLVNALADIVVIF